jgi:sphingomyelin phosphodiesterase acid-like 3
MRISAIRTIITAAAWLLALATSPCGVHAAELPFTAGAGQGVFLHVSDLHFNPFADPSIVRRLVAAPVEHWSAILRASKATPFWIKGQDTTFALLTSMLAAAKGPAYDYVLSTGDHLSHDFKDEFIKAGGTEDEYVAFVIKTMRFVDRMLKAAFPGIPVITALGNNDATCGDYVLAPNDPMLPVVGRDLPAVARHPEALREYMMGGSYAVPHPKVPKHTIVVLSDVYLSQKYQDACGKTGTDPGSAELSWLEWTLYQARLAGRTVTIAMHIPPGIDSYSSSHDNTCPLKVVSFWQDDYARRFLALVARYQDQVRISFAGHTHMDDFRVISDPKGTPLLATRITPALTPLFGNNPAFTVLLYSRTDASVADYATFYLANLAKVGPGVAPEWTLEYTFKDAYKTPGYDAASLAALAKSLRTDETLRDTFKRYYAVKGQSPINAPNWNAFSCAQTAITADAFQSCACPTAAPDPGAASAAPR